MDNLVFTSNNVILHLQSPTKSVKVLPCGMKDHPRSRMTVINKASNFVSAFVFGCAIFVCGLGFFIHEQRPTCFLVSPPLRSGDLIISPRDSLQLRWQKPAHLPTTSPRDLVASNSAPTSIPTGIMTSHPIVTPDSPTVEIVASSPQEEMVSRLADLRLLPDSFKARLPFHTTEQLIDQAAAKVMSLTTLTQD